MHTVVLGGGLAGLACAHELATRGHRVTVLEREPHVGGMASSFVEDGEEHWSYDFGPHRLYGDDAETTRHIEELLGDNAVRAKRTSRILLFGRFFDYPLVPSNVLRRMPRGLLLRAVCDYLAVRAQVRLGLCRLSEASFEGWVTRRFGRTLYRVFFGEYTEKLWGLPPDRISADWASQRISLLNLWDAVKKSLWRAQRRGSPKLASEFIYPKHGGIGALARGYVRRIEEHGGRVLTSAPALRVYRDGDRVTGVCYGKHDRVDIAADRYVSTIPVTALARALTPAAPAHVRRSAAALEYVSIVFVYLKLARPSMSSDSWIYLPERHLTVHRLAEFKNFSATCAPPDKTMVCAEITCRRGDAIWRSSPVELAEIAAGDLARVGLIKREQVLASFVKKIPYAYPVYGLDYRHDLQPVVAFVHRLRNLHSTGRQGHFGYTSMYQSIAMGRTLGAELAAAPAEPAVAARRAAQG